MFVAYTVWSNCNAGEEVREPRRTIPKAIIITMVLTMLLYITVAIVSVGSVGVAALSPAGGVKAAPLEIAAVALNSWQCSNPLRCDRGEVYSSISSWLISRAASNGTSSCLE